jgi:4-amino-4-deoxy-L-arabinose transferase-like glycosyltransferase
MDGHLPIRIALLAILFLAAVLRLSGINWDDGIGAHPDERYIVGVAENLLWSGELDPFEFAPDYAYGHIPLYLLAIVRGLAPAADALILGRVLAALFDLGTVTLTFALGRRLRDERVGLLAAGFVGLTTLHVQQAHFYTVDTALAFFTIGLLLFSVRLAESGQVVDAWVTGAWLGLAVGTKASAVLQIIPLAAAFALVPDRRWARLWRCSVAAIVIFALTNPFALVDLSNYSRNVGRQAAILQGKLDVPYTRQYSGTLPYIYPILQQCRWGMGILAGLTASLGSSYVVWRAVRARLRRGEWVVLGWVLPLFAFTGALYAKFPRYFLPLVPLLAICAAILVADLARGHSATAVLFCLLLYGSMLFRCVSLVSMYRVPHPWVSASEWFYENATPGTIIATEEWDHVLPLDTSGYEVRMLPVFEEETPEKWEMMEASLAEADYVVIASRRAYATLTDMPERYPRTARYYKRLFEGDLGFEPVVCFGRFPGLASIVLADDPTDGLDFTLPEVCRTKRYRVFRWGQLDESFVVYDHPQVLVFKVSR